MLLSIEWFTLLGAFGKFAGGKILSKAENRSSGLFTEERWLFGLFCIITIAERPAPLCLVWEALGRVPSNVVFCWI